MVKLKRKLRGTIELYYKLDRQAKRAKIVDHRYMIQVNDLPPFYPSEVLFEKIMFPYDCYIESCESIVEENESEILFYWHIIHLKVSPKAGAQLQSLIYRYA